MIIINTKGYMLGNSIAKCFRISINTIISNEIKV